MLGFQAHLSLTHPLPTVPKNHCPLGSTFPSSRQEIWVGYSSGLLQPCAHLGPLPWLPWLVGPQIHFWPQTGLNKGLAGGKGQHGWERLYY